MVRRIVFGLFVCSLIAGQASAQNWSFDARKVAMGSPGSGENLATRMIDDESDYRAIVPPLTTGPYVFHVELEGRDPDPDFLNSGQGLIFGWMGTLKSEGIPASVE